MQNKNKLIVAGAMALVVLGAVGVRAATSFSVPTTLGYSGTLLTGSTAAADGNYILTFTLYAAATGGSPLWTETQTSVPVTVGRFSVVLGSTTSIPATALNSKALWLEITVGSEVLSPRQQVTSVPFALRSPLQCRTVTVNSGAGGGWTGSASATAACDSTETIMGGGCVNPRNGFDLVSQSFADDISYTCLFMPNVGSTATPDKAGQAQARCCKM